MIINQDNQEQPRMGWARVKASVGEKEERLVAVEKARAVGWAVWGATDQISGMT
jgi:hypothetical protein